MIDQSGVGIAQNSVISAIRVRSPENILCSVYPTAVDTSSYVSLVFTEPVFIDTGNSLELDITIDIDESAQPRQFQFHLYGSAVEVFDATSEIRFTALEGSFPITSGVAEIVVPAERISFEADGTMPKNIVPGEKIKAFDLHFERTGISGGSRALLEYISLYIADEGGEIVDIMTEIETISVENNTGEIATSIEQIDDRIRIEFVDTQGLDPEESIVLGLYLKVASQSKIKMLSAFTSQSD